MAMTWHTLSVEEALKETGSRKEGLDDTLAKQRLEKYGRNELLVKKNLHPLYIFFRQFLDLMILVLVAAAAVSLLIGDISDTIVILGIIVLNAIIGFIQEYRTEKAMEALKKMATLSATVLRNEKIVELPSWELVPGDIVILEAGNTVPADLRLLESHALTINEASLTGESNAVEKNILPLKGKDLLPGDQINMAFKGTHVTNGSGRGLAVATGMSTEFGKIAKMLEKAKSRTPLQKRLNEFGKKLTIGVIFLCIALFFAGYLRGENVNRMLFTSISLAVAAIPEALPAVITVSLALGARRLAKRQALVRKLYAVETLGSVTYICTDKTGTLTKNEMTVAKIWAKDEEKVGELLLAMSLNHSLQEKDGTIQGDPTELAMVNYAKQQKKYEKVNEIPFDPKRKAMTTIHNRNGDHWVITKGAPEKIVEMGVNEKIREEIKDEQEKMTREGMRVIGFAGKSISSLPEKIDSLTIEKDMQFIGLAGLVDPPREEAKEAISQCKSAGIVPIMITGDHPLTAASIAREIGIIDREDQQIITGKELAEKSRESFLAEVEKIRVYARVSPEQKLNIVDALQEKEQFVAMTGDGVNDAPSLKKANIGIAMGVTGTDVAKEAAHMVLLDDNFASIVKAIKEGRRIYDNIRKFIKYILTGNAAEILTIFAAPLLGLPMPLLPVHILWINLMTDGLPALALSAETSEKNIMHRLPRRPNEGFFSKGLGLHVLLVGIVMAALTICTQWYMVTNNIENWQTIVFTTLCFCQLWHVTAIRSEFSSIFATRFLANKPMLLALLVTVLLQLAVIYIPFFQPVFHTQPLSLPEILVTVAVSSIVFWVVELEKWMRRKSRRRSGKAMII
jgi:P-type Ca2+ transporter type 2C